MIIWGSKGLSKTIAQGQFFCPICGSKRPYEYKQIGKYFTLYFVPLFQTKKLGDYIECQVCFQTFKPEVLNYSNQIEDEIRKESERAQLFDEITQQLDAGLSIQIIAAGLKKSGLEDNVVGRILYAVTSGQFRECSTCGSDYRCTVEFCSICGSKLLPPKTL